MLDITVLLSSIRTRMLFLGEFVENLLSIDSFIIYFYLALTLFVGIYSGRNIKSFKDYAIANRSFGAPVLVIALLATIMGGTSTIGITENIYKNGIIMVFAVSGYILSYLFIAKYVAPRMERFNGKISVGDLMGLFYGKWGQVITGILGAAFCIGILTAQCKAIGYTFESIFKLDSEMGILIGGSVLVLYSAFGGMRAVTITDLIQFAILIVMVPLVSNVAANYVGGVINLVNQVPESHLKVLSHDKFYKYLEIWFVWGVFPAFLVSPPIIQRMLMAQNSKQISQMFYLGAIFTIPFTMMVGVIGLVSLIMFPSISPGLALPTVINELLPDVIKGFAVAGILAVIMSTADSFLHSAGICLTHDVLKTYFGKEFTDEFNFSRVITFVVGFTAMIISMYTDSILEIELYAIGLWGPIITIPLIIGIFGLNIPNKYFVLNTFLTAFTFVIWNLLIPDELKYLAALASIFVCACSYGIVYKLFGKVNNIRIASDELDYVITGNFKALLKKVMQLIPTPKNVLAYSQKQVETYGADYHMFGIFCALNYIVPYFMWSYDDNVNYPQTLMLRMIAGLLCVGLLLKDYWLDSMKRWFPVYWNFTLLFCLSFSTTVMILVSNATAEWLINLALAVFLLAILVDWVTFIIISSVGSILGFMFFKGLIGEPELQNADFKTIYLMVYVITFSSLIGLLFARKKQLRESERLETLKLFGGAMAHEVKTPLSASMFAFQALDDLKGYFKPSKNGNKYTAEMDKEAYNFLIDGVINTSKLSINRGIRVVDMLLMSLKDKMNADDFGKYSISETVKEALGEYGLTEIEEKRIKVNYANDFEYEGSKTYIKHAIFNLIKNSFKYAGKDAEVTIWFKNHALYFMDNGKGIPANQLPNIFDKFYTSSSSGTGIGLSFVKMVMESMGGTVSCSSVEGLFTKFRLGFK